MTDRNGFEPRGVELGDMQQSAQMAQAFSAEMERMRQSMMLTSRELGTLTGGIEGGLRRAFQGVMFDGLKLGDALRGIGRAMADTMLAIAMKPVQQAIAGAMAQGIGGAASAALPFANGAAFTQGRVSAFARGGIVSGPVQFPMRGGVGLMGEAGPEAIMPLTRGADGRLGVHAQGGAARPVNVTINVSTPDVAGFARSQSQIAAQVSRLLARGARNA
ncbi:MAG: phage tail tape measure protein [Paracoccus sp. (in: a-proteobacteria)]|nr:phage tail tape measure protein [Paracoccus sp. (in: a-proteobacteria)]